MATMKQKYVRAALWLVTGGSLWSVAASPPTAASRPGAETGRAAAVRLEVDLSERKLYVHHGGERMNTFEVAVGEPEHPTPQGDFTIDRIIWDPAWVPPNTEWAEDKEKKGPSDPDNPMEAAKLFFDYPDYYIHGTDAVHTLGQAESHGCIRMRPADVEALAEFVQQHGGEERSGDWYGTVRAREAPTTEITLPDPVPLSVHR